MKNDNSKRISRRTAQSGTVDYAVPVVLHETSRSRIVMIPFFIPHSDHSELAIKFVTYKKESPPNDWSIVEEKSLSLNEEPARKLLSALNAHLAVAAESTAGDYIVMRIQNGVAQIDDHDPIAVADALSKALSQPGIVEHLRETELSSQLINALKGAIRLSEMRSAITQLRVLLESNNHAESNYQKWCEEHSWAFGNAYVLRDNVHNISPGDSLDILLPTVISGYREIVELKRPDRDVIRWDPNHRNYYFSIDVSKAIGQCHRYIDVLHDVAAKGLDDHPEIIAYHPRAIIVIGRSIGWSRDQARALHGLNYRLSGVVVMTYDQLLAQGERLVEMMGVEYSTESEVSQ